MKKLLGIFFLSAFLAGCVTTPDQNKRVKLIESWTASGVFASPESAIHDPARDLIYVSNVKGYTENGAGYLSAVSPDGEIVAAKWLEGLNAPTGMAIDGDTLYVADFNRLAEIDIRTKTIRQFYAAPDDNPGLNDVTIARDGAVYVSASNLGAVYKLEEGALHAWAKDDALRFANGLYANEDGLLVAGFYLNRIAWRTKEINSFGDGALEDLESIETDGADGYFLTMIGDKPIYHLDKDGRATPVLARDTFSADIDVTREGLLIAPSGGDTVAAFKIQRSE